MNNIKLLIIIILLSHIAKCFQDNSMKLIWDYVTSKSTMLSLHSCWNTDKLLQFMKITNFGKELIRFASLPKFFLENTHFWNNLVIVDMNNCPMTWSLLLKLNQTNSFVSPRKYFILIDDVLNLIPILQNFTIYPESEVVIAEKYGFDYKLYGVYRINAISEIIWENYGYWSSDYGLIEHLKRCPASQRRRDLRKQSLKVMIKVTNNDTWNHLEDFKYPSIDSFTKLSFGSSKCVFDYCNATVTYVSTEYFGYPDKTGKYNGIVGALINEEIDTSGSAIYPTIDRVGIITYMTMQSPYYIKFILMKPPLSYVKNIFISAFDLWVWAVMVVTLAVFITACFLIYNVEAKQEMIGYQDKLSPTDVILISLEAVSQQGTSMDPQRISGRILGLVFFLSFFFIFIAYSGNIVAMLQAEVKLKSRKELLRTRLEIGAEDNDYMRLYLSRDTDDVGQQIYKRIGRDGFYLFKRGMEKVREGYFAYHVELGEAYDYILANFTNAEMCCLQEIEGYFEHFRGYSITKKRSPYKEIFKTGFLKVDEYGLKLRNYNRWYVKPLCQTTSSNYASVGLTESRTAFLLLIYGTLLALLFLLLEKLTYCIRKT